MLGAVEKEREWEGKGGDQHNKGRGSMILDGIRHGGRSQKNVIFQGTYEMNDQKINRPTK